jgi:hypothetical protein
MNSVSSAARHYDVEDFQQIKLAIPSGTTL